ncbi:hypothetical protein DSO57_1028122, partial [Entomophthora muscae]
MLFCGREDSLTLFLPSLTGVIDCDVELCLAFFFPVLVSVTNSYQLCLSKSPNYKIQTPTSRGPPGRPQFFGLESEQDLTLENPFKLDEPNVPTPILSTLGVPDKTANKRASPATDSKITQACTEGETENFPIECGPPRGDQSHNLTREFELPHFKPANEITPAIDATKDWEDLEIGKTRADRICE